MTSILIDNYDSFTWNVYQYLVELGAHVQVFRNDKVTVDDVVKIKPRNIVISPGPGHPRSAAVSNDLIKHFAGIVPILGVCLGEQCIYEVYGGTVSPIGSVVHGKTSSIQHDGKGIFAGVDQGIHVTRYHSLAGDTKTLPQDLEVSATTADGIIMAVRHKRFVVEGVQFHPESIVSQQGKALFANFLAYDRGTWDEVKMPVAAVQESILERIYAQRQLDVSHSTSLPGQALSQLREYFAQGLAPSSIDLYERLKSHRPAMAVIGEIKRASPSKGDIDSIANAVTNALQYTQAGVAGISVLCEPKWFKGSINDMQMVRTALEPVVNRPAILCKDFIFSEYQILQARLYGADTVLLIVAMLPNESKIAELLTVSRSLGMEPLVEVANEAEMKIAVKVGAKVIGVNNRNLHDFTVDMSNTKRLSSAVPKDTLLVALSGISTPADVRVYQDAGASAILVGESLMRSENKHAFIQTLIGNSKSTQ